MRAASFLVFLLAFPLLLVFAPLGFVVWLISVFMFFAAPKRVIVVNTIQESNNV